jgi:predicted SprT family Zn-dependent metalloprotease
MYQYGETEMREMITAEFERVHREACDKWPAYALRGRPALKFFTKGATAGWAKNGPWTVEINLHLARQNWTMIRNTISHEIAHMVGFVFGKKGHCKTWKAIHRALGGSGERCYNSVKEGVTPVMARQTYLHGYRLEGTDVVIWIGTAIHNKMQRYGEHRIHTATKIKIYARHYTGQKKLKYG